MKSSTDFVHASFCFIPVNRILHHKLQAGLEPIQVVWHSRAANHP